MGPQPFPFKRGKLPAIRTLKTMRSAIAMAAALDVLGDPPGESNNYLSAVYVAPQIYGNDQIGDCVEVDTAYGLIIRTANVSNAVVPTIHDVYNLYEVFGYDPSTDPPTDPGTSELAMCQYLQSTGWLGHKLDAFASIDPANTNHVKWCIQLFGGVRVGWTLPDYAEQQFRFNQPWDVMRGRDPGSLGGHDTRLVRYAGDTFYTATWGRWQQPVTIPFINTFCEEAHPELYFDWIAAQGQSPSGFDLATLEAKLKEAAA